MYCKRVSNAHVIFKKIPRFEFIKKLLNVQIPEIFQKFSKLSNYQKVLWSRGPENRFHLWKVPVIEGLHLSEKINRGLLRQIQGKKTKVPLIRGSTYQAATVYARKRNKMQQQCGGNRTYITTI